VAVAFHEFATFDLLSQSLADKISRDIRAAVDARGFASLVVPGGTTPGAFFDVLRETPAPWDKVTITLTDERWVATDTERSNERLVRARLLTGGLRARVVSLKSDQARARDAEAEIEGRLGAIPRPFDVVLAGMGDDGHTASWIPGSQGLAEALDPHSRSLVRAIQPPKSSGLDERMTLTLSALVDARTICVLLRGEAKRKSYEKALAGRDTLAMPIRSLMFQGHVPVEFFWAAR
jgi:6-phosphogluconolactonase